MLWHVCRTWTEGRKFGPPKKFWRGVPYFSKYATKAFQVPDDDNFKGDATCG